MAEKMSDKADTHRTPSGVLLTPLGITRIISPRSIRGFTSEELSDIVGGQITLVPLRNDDNPRRQNRIMCINAEGMDQNHEFNSKAYSIYEVSCWGTVLIMDAKDFVG